MPTFPFKLDRSFSTFSNMYNPEHKSGIQPFQPQIPHTGIVNSECGTCGPVVGGDDQVLYNM